MPDKIVSKPSTQAYREGWDRIWGQSMNVRDEFRLAFNKAGKLYRDKRKLHNEKICNDYLSMIK
jgi:hypothetical protein